jgi:hypothetical protein
MEAFVWASWQLHRFPMRTAFNDISVSIEKSRASGSLSVMFRNRPRNLKDALYQRDIEFIAFARPNLAVSAMGSSSVLPVFDIQAMSVA